ncbi:transcription/translation regulatory transformer protein RfaH [Natronospirillum operosum]|uniref:Transcription/translation regulatory transformer protein RfaH n=1 Tax=Natronospirillum operosum TaxID=2759953 RepID=A0A4Z0WAP9_9GAMM|nr:transcription/translation regulatory transformer protein RfaH [Natronospirillum operosum]TGG95222.1 transcription/translation regulatory transformer protein RfaH [Natronospirillum operosum]
MTIRERNNDTDVTETDPASQQLRWYLLQCKPRECFRAQDNLERQAIDTYLPQHSVQRRRARQVYWNKEPLFPHYVFIQASPQTNWATIRYTRGVTKVVGFDGKPTPVPDHIVIGLQKKCAELAGLEPEPLFRAGERVTINEGCFRELEAIVKCTHGEQRVVLLLDLLNRTQQVELPADIVSRR